MEKLEWCKGKKSGIQLREENINLAKEYLENAEESLRVLSSIRKTKSNMWLAATKYYIEYFTVYAFLMRVGIKCEIHDCTIELTKHFEKEGLLPAGTYQLLEKDKALRIDNQYYLKNKPVEIDLEKIRNFVLEIKNRIDNLSKEDIRKARMIIE